MWTADIRDGNVTVSSTSTGTSSDHKRPLDLSINEAKEPLPNIFTSDTSGDKRQKTTSCEIHGKKHQKSNKLMNEAIGKWQLCNLAKCVFENTVNQMLEDLSDHSVIYRQDFNIENEAVLMAIEEHGLRQQSMHCSCPESPIPESHSFSKTDFYELHPTNTINTYDLSEENPEFNFENNFLATAVSVAIEEKGLSMYPV